MTEMIIKYANLSLTLSYKHRRFEQRFLCYFLYPLSCSPKESRAALAAYHSEMCVKSCLHREHILQHIAIDAFVSGYVLCPALKGFLLKVLR